MNKFRIALAATLVALAAVSAVDSASAQNAGDYGPGLDNVGYLSSLRHSPLGLLMRSARL
jgi:hypothetical protein